MVRTIARLMTIGRDLLTKAETVTVVAIEADVLTLVEAREIIAEVHLMIRRKAKARLTSWIARARASLVASFASDVARDEAAVRAAITSPWSNGQTEGKITCLKLVKTSNVRPRENRSASSQLISAQNKLNCTKIASEPLFRAEKQGRPPRIQPRPLKARMVKFSSYLCCIKHQAST